MCWPLPSYSVIRITQSSEFKVKHAKEDLECIEVSISATRELCPLNSTQLGMWKNYFGVFDIKIPYHHFKIGDLYTHNP